MLMPASCGVQGPGEMTDGIGAHGIDFFHGDLIVAAHLDFRAQFADVLDQVVSERIVVVEYENQLERNPDISLQRKLVGRFTGDTSF